MINDTCSRRRRLLLPVAMLMLALVLAACGGSDDGEDGESSVRLVNATADADSIDLTVREDTDDDDADEVRLFAAVARDAQSGYQDLDSASYTVRLKRAGAASSLAVGWASVDKDDRYTVFAFGREGDYRMLTALDDEDEPSSGQAKVRVFNAAPDAGALDIYLTEADAELTDTIPTAANVAGGTMGYYTSIERGTYRLRVTGVGDKDDLRLDVPAIELANRGRVTIVLQPGPGGVLVNALLSQYRGALEAHKNTLARVRLVAGATANAAVSASLGGTSLNVNLRSPSIGSWALVPAGNVSAVITVNAATSLGGSVALAGAGDYTLAVYGQAAAPTWRVISDDNRLPANGDRARMRLLHMAVDADTNLTLVKDYEGVANDVPYGNASSYAEVTASSSARVEVTSPLSVTPLFLNEEVALPSRGVFTVFVLGGAAAPTGILRRER